MRKILIICIVFTNSLWGYGQGSISETFNIGDIPTSLNTFNPGCNGANTAIEITLPAGTSYTVTGIDIQYNMTSLNGGWMSDQRSRVFCENSNAIEAVNNGVGNSVGTYSYNRPNVDIGNGTYPGGTTLRFQMQAWRTFGDTENCGFQYNVVDNLTWTITLYYSLGASPDRVGIGTTTPDMSAMLDIQSAEKGLLIPRLSSAQMNGILSPATGLMVFNTDESNFRYFNGTGWEAIVNSTNSSSDKIEDADNTAGIYVEEQEDDILFKTLGLWHGKMDRSWGSVYLGQDAHSYDFDNYTRLLIDAQSDDVDLVINDFHSPNSQRSTILMGATGDTDYNSDAMGIRYSGIDGELQILNRDTALNPFTFEYDPVWSTPRMAISKNGNVRIGLQSVSDGSYKLSVDGEIISEELMIKNSEDWPDYVFDEDYELLDLESVAKYIEEHNHLPNIPSAKEIEDQGIASGEMHKMQMEKIEELTLYILELKEEINILKRTLKNICNE